MLRGSSIFNSIYNALAQREGRKTTLPTLMSMTGLTERQIRSSLTYARNTSPLHAEQIEVLESGRAWRFKSDGITDVSATADEVTKEVEMGSTHIWKKIFNVLTEREGAVLHKDLIAKLASTDEQEITPQQVANAMLTILRRDELRSLIEVKWAGRAWKYVGPQTAGTQEKPKPTRSVSVPIRGSVFRYLTLNPGKPLFADDVAAELGFTRKQVQQAMHHYVYENEGTRGLIAVLTPSHAWQYNVTVPTPEPELAAVAATNGHVSNAVERVTEAVVPATPAQVQTQTQAVPSGGRLFEEVTQLPGSDVILIKEADSGAIYRATPLA